MATPASACTASGRTLPGPAQKRPSAGLMSSGIRMSQPRCGPSLARFRRRCRRFAILPRTSATNRHHGCHVTHATPDRELSRRAGCRPSPRPPPACAGRARRRWPTGGRGARSFFCSRMCALQPATRAQVNIDVNMCAGTSAKSSTTADQNSTLVASTRSGRRACSSSSAAFSSASAISKRGAPSSRGGAPQHAGRAGPRPGRPGARSPSAARRGRARPGRSRRRRRCARPPRSCAAPGTARRRAAGRTARRCRRRCRPPRRRRWRRRPGR